MTQSLMPSKVSARPKRPDVVRVAPEIVPSWSRTASVTVEPLVSSNPKAATRPSLSTVTTTFAEVRVLPAASRATALSVCWPSVSPVVFQLSE